MQFKDSKQGYAVYIIDRKSVSVSKGTITNNPVSHFDNNFPGAKMVVDICISYDGLSKTYVLDDSAEIGYVGDIVVTINRECVVNELERIMSSSTEALKMTEYHKSAVEKCDRLLDEYSESHRERSEYSGRLDAMDSKIERLSEMISSFINSNSN